MQRVNTISMAGGLTIMSTTFEMQPESSLVIFDETNQSKPALATEPINVADELLVKSSLIYETNSVSIG